MPIFKDIVIPASVFVTLSLFLYKEISESHRRYKTKIAKKNAFGHVLGRELKENYNSLDQFIRIIEFLDSHKNATTVDLELIHLRHGHEACKVRADNDSMEMPLPVFSTQWYEKLLVEIAERDDALLTKITAAYDSIYFLIEKRNFIASFLDGELTPFQRNCIKFQVGMLISEYERIKDGLSSAFQALTGKDNIFP